MMRIMGSLVIQVMGEGVLPLAAAVGEDALGWIDDFGLVLAAAGGDMGETCGGDMGTGKQLYYGRPNRYMPIIPRSVCPIPALCYKGMMMSNSPTSTSGPVFNLNPFVVSTSRPTSRNIRSFSGSYGDVVGNLGLSGSSSSSFSSFLVSFMGGRQVQFELNDAGVFLPKLNPRKSRQQSRYDLRYNRYHRWRAPGTRPTWIRPKDHDYVAGRPGMSDFAPGDPLVRWVDDVLPAGHSFAANHDSLVDFLRNLGFPDWAVNTPTMYHTYFFSLYKELVNVPTGIYNEAFGTEHQVPFPHFIEDDYPNKRPKP